jgi:hypothetical protein
VKNLRSVPGRNPSWSAAETKGAAKSVDTETRPGRLQVLSPKKSGSAMSDKQMARAAVDGRMLVFRTGVLVPLEGYVVGMDDFHWLIATPANLDEGEPVLTTLIHKSCPLVTFTETYLVDEDQEDRTKIQQIGGHFWTWCVTSGLVRTLTDQEQHQ